MFTHLHRPTQRTFVTDAAMLEVPESGWSGFGHPKPRPWYLTAIGHGVVTHRSFD
jgi:hypothetical protein